MQPAVEVEMLSVTVLPVMKNLIFLCIYIREIVVSTITLLIYMFMIYLPVPVAARSKAWICGCSVFRIVGSNPTGRHGCLSLVSGCVFR